MFKSAMIAARDEGLFVDDDIFCSFPRGCCGPTCDLLATFLNDHVIETIYVWGDYGLQSRPKFVGGARAVYNQDLL